MKSFLAQYLSALAICGPLLLPKTVVAQEVIDVFAGIPGDEDVSEEGTISRIFDGTIVTDENEIPAYALLCFNGQTTCNGCGGTLIAPNKVLTAAHCMTATATPTAVLIGALTNTGGDFIGVSSIAIHPDFKVDTTNILLNDVAVLTLATNSSTTPLLFNRDTTAPVDSLTVTAYGFGGIDAVPTQSTVLRTADFPVISVAQCQATFSQIDPTKHICVQNVDEGICAGDSGGPIVDASKTTVFGVSSFGQAGCMRNAVDVFTDLANYASWIDEQVSGTPVPTTSPGGTVPTTAPVSTSAPVATPAPVAAPTTAPVSTLSPTQQDPTIAPTIAPTTSESTPAYVPPKGAAVTAAGSGFDGAYVAFGGNGAASSIRGGRTGRIPVVRAPTPMPTPRPTSTL